MAQNNSSSGVGFLGFLTLLFIGLKLAGFIAWSWIWVLAPMWIPIGLALFFLLVICVIAAVTANATAHVR